MIELNCCPVCRNTTKIKIHAKKVCAVDDNFSNYGSSQILNYILKTVNEQSVTINTMRCENCDHLFLTPTFSMDEIKKLYSHETIEAFKEFKQMFELKTKIPWQQHLGGENWLEKLQESLVKRPKIIKDVIDKYATSNKDKILDIGGSDSNKLGESGGHNLLYFRNESQLFVMDLLDSEKKDENIIYIGDYGAASGFAPFDIIVSTHTLEHVVDLDQELKDIISITKKGSHVYVETPCESFSIIRRKLAMDIGAHVNFFTRSSLQNLFILNGFRTKYFALHLMPYNEQRVYVYCGLFEYRGPKKQKLNRNFSVDFVRDGVFMAKNKYFNKNKKITYKIN